MVKTALEVRKILKNTGYACSLVNARFIKPIDEEMIREMSREHRLLVTLEENVEEGGFGERVSAYLDTLHSGMTVLRIAIPDTYVEHGSVDILKEVLGLNPETIARRVITAYIGE
jgi:1-deoxy-D-xylulose-5-phosphate synthase